MSRISSLVSSQQDIDSEIVPVPQWGDVKIQVKGMSARLRSDFLTALNEAREGEDLDELANIEMQLIVRSCYDPEDGSLAFSEEDIEMLLGKSGAAIGVLSEAVYRVSGLGKAAGKDSPGDSPDSTASPSVDSTST